MAEPLLEADIALIFASMRALSYLRYIIALISIPA